MPQIAIRRARHAVARRRGSGFDVDLQQLVAAHVHASGDTTAVEVVPHGARELGLRAIQLDDARQVVRVVERDVQRRVVDACRARGVGESA